MPLDNNDSLFAGYTETGRPIRVPFVGSEVAEGAGLASAPKGVLYFCTANSILSVKTGAPGTNTWAVIGTQSSSSSSSSTSSSSSAP